MKLSSICFFVIFFLSNTKQAYSQQERLTYSFEKSLFRNFKPPPELDKDSCINATIFIKLYVNSDFKVSSIEFSDNAGPYAQELNRKKHLFSTSSIEEYSRKYMLNNYHIIIPVFFEKLTNNCPADSLSTNSISSLSRFSKENILGKIYLADPIKMILYPANY